MKPGNGASECVGARRLSPSRGSARFSVRKFWGARESASWRTLKRPEGLVITRDLKQNTGLATLVREMKMPRWFEVLGLGAGMGL